MMPESGVRRGGPARGPYTGGVFNLPTGGELLIILLVALIVLGPDKLPEAMRKFGQFYGEARRMATGFTSELKSALDEPKTAFDEMAGSTKRLVDDARSGLLGTGEPVLAPGERVVQPHAADVELPGEDLSDVELPGEDLADVGAAELADDDAPPDEPRER